MHPINTVEGLLFRAYLSGYNLSFLHRCINLKDEEIDTPGYRQAAHASSDLDFEKKTDRAKRLTDILIHQSGKNEILPFFHPQYPKQLLTIKNYPQLLFVKGQLPFHKCAAIIGTRDPSPFAAQKTNKVVNIFAEQDYGIISGLALGIDTLAHEAALQCRTYTAAILPRPIDHIYPEANKALAQRIIENGGALISEQAPNFAPVGNSFVLRNRIQAAMSTVVMPIEMGKDSGTYHTINFAIKYGRKTIIPKPTGHETKLHALQYEGLLQAIKKCKGSPHFVLLHKLSQLREALLDQVTKQGYFEF